jgi:NAD(P)-dependent dehydrogenase (short-subunit alcohol dehydrogenase family)
MRERGWGRVIQIASGEATNPYATMPDSAASKAALVNLSVITNIYEIVGDITPDEVKI